MQSNNARERPSERRTTRTVGFTLIEIMIVVVITGILLAIAIPTFLTARISSRAKTCVSNLKQIDTAKQQYAMDAKQASSYVFSGTYSGTTQNELVPQYIQSFPTCPAGGAYTVGASTSNPTCSYGTTDAGYPHTFT